MSPKGTTTPVHINLAEVNSFDKKVLCTAICKCKAAPAIGKNGQSLKQVCVSKALSELDEVLSHKSQYKPEINYDMTKSPPAPIMSRDVETKGHSWLRGWIDKYWASDADHPPFKAGQGMVRRPDVVIVKDSSKPPTQDNIKQVVEIKFEDDVWGREQMADYETISGKGKLASLEPDDCACDSTDSEPPKIPVEDMGKLGTLAAILYFLLTKKPPPRVLAM
jgi:hypothetical protein